ncbi:phosphopantetheine-binding protein, partial [Streptomyces sp. NPDC056491]|uniref:phosphopantetheine-binding protein n=1 Tax=Streptomyces sp. NPDC056491 TaxID=3345837 RepID=UPI003686049E
LPTAMIPTYLTHLTHLPQLPNGKTNTKQLPPPEALLSERTPVAPRTPDEFVLAKLWSEVLGIQDVSVQDDFYDVGGDSLRAVQVFQLLSDAGSPVPLSVLLGNHTIEQLATQLGSGTGSGTGSSPGPASDADTDSAEVREVHEALAP